MANKIYSIFETAVFIRNFLGENNLRFIERSHNFSKDDITVFKVMDKMSNTILETRPYVSPSIEINYYNYFMATDDYVDWIRQDSDSLVLLKDAFKKLNNSSLVNIVFYDMLKKDSSNLEHDLSFDYENLMSDFKKRSEIYTQEKFVLHIRTFVEADDLKRAYDLLPPGDIEFTNVL